MSQCRTAPAGVFGGGGEARGDAREGGGVARGGEVGEQGLGSVGKNKCVGGGCSQEG
jgi:hypothetical protein